MTKSYSLFCCLALFLFSINSALANDSAESSSEDDSTVLGDVSSLFDDTHSLVSDRFSNFVIGIDDFIASSESEQQKNKSWGRLRLDLIKPGGEGLEFGGKIKLRVVLPRSEQRFRLLLSNEDDTSSAANSDAAQREQIAADDTGDVALALRFIRTVRSEFRLKYDVGARVKDDAAQLFGRFIVGYKKKSRLDVNHTLTNKLTYFSRSGYDNSFTIDTRRNFLGKERLFFRNLLEFRGKKGLKGIGIGNTIGIYANISERRALAFEGLTGYATSLNGDETDRFRGTEFRIRYRQSIWRPWFYYEVWPSVSWSSSNDYERAFGGQFRIEVTFGNI